MKHLLLFCLFCVSLTQQSCRAQQKANLDADVEAQLWKLIFQNESAKYVSQTPARFELTNLYLPSTRGSLNGDKLVLSQQDSASLSRQIEQGPALLFSENAFPGKTVLSLESLSKALKTLEPKSFLQVSRPVIFQGKAWIFIERFCGTLCGSSEVQVFELLPNGPRLIHREQISIS